MTLLTPDKMYVRSMDKQESINKKNSDHLLWQSVRGAFEEVGKMSDMAKTMVEKTTQELQTATQSATEAVVKTANQAGQAAIAKITETGQPVVDATSQAIKTINQVVDPLAVGGSFLGMTAGEALGGAIGSVAGSVVGPVGTVMGMEMGALAGSYVGLKLGYDVTHEITHAEKAELTLVNGQKVQEIAEFLQKKAGGNLGVTMGTVGGVMIGGAIAGPMGGVVGAVVGDALGGQLGEDAVAQFNKKIKEIETLETNKDQQIAAQNWLLKITSNFSGETGTTVVGGVIGKLVMGSPGEQMGKKLGTIAGKKINWSFQPTTIQQDQQKTQQDQQTIQ